ELRRGLRPRRRLRSALRPRRGREKGRRGSAPGARLLVRRGELEEIEVAPPLALLLQPLLEARRLEPVRRVLLLRRPDRQHVRVLVARVAGVPADPAPLDVVALGDIDEPAPEVLVLHGPRLSAPASPPPGRDPLAHPL